MRLDCEIFRYITEDSNVNLQKLTCIPEKEIHVDDSKKFIIIKIFYEKVNGKTTFEEMSAA